MRLLLLNESLATVFPVFAMAKVNEDLTALFATFIAVLAIARFAYVVRFHSQTLRWFMVTMHAIEVPFFLATYMRNVLPVRATMDAGDRLTVEIILGGICLHPLLFALLGPSRRIPAAAAAARGGKAST